MKFQEVCHYFYKLKWRIIKFDRYQGYVVVDGSNEYVAFLNERLIIEMIQVLSEGTIIKEKSLKSLVDFVKNANYN